MLSTTIKKTEKKKNCVLKTIKSKIMLRLPKLIYHFSKKVRANLSNLSFLSLKHFRLYIPLNPEDVSYYDLGNSIGKAKALEIVPEENLAVKRRKDFLKLAEILFHTCDYAKI